MRNSFKVFTVMVFTCFLLQGSVFGQDKQEDIRKLFTVMKATEMIDKMTENYTQIAKYQINQSSKEDESTQEMLDTLMEDTKAMVKEMVNKEMVALYDKHFTQEEIKQFIKFYESDAGQKFIEKTPVIQKELMGVMMNEYMPEMQEKMKSRMEKMRNSTDE